MLPESLRPPAPRQTDQRFDGDGCQCPDCLESYELPHQPENPDVND